jgi:outer membrane protein assembly factor BamB
VNAARGLSLLVLAAACAANPGRSALPPAAATTASTTLPIFGSLEVDWIDRELDPIDQPRAVAGLAVGIVTTPERKLFLVGLDPATGRTRWRQPITPSTVTPGVRVIFGRLDDGKIVYFRPTSTGYGVAELVLADAATGADLAKTPEAHFTSTPSLCGSGKDVCATSRTAGEGRDVAHRLETATGRYVEEGNHLPTGAREIGEGGLFDLGDRPGNTLALIRDGQIRWRTPVSAAFPPGFTTDNGWSWLFFPDQHIFTGSVIGPVAIDGTKRTLDLTRGSATAALSETDGSVIWRDAGSADCRMPTGDQPVRCRRRGTVTVEQGGSNPSYRNLDVTIEGFDVRTGKTTWSVPMGDDGSLVAGDVRQPIAGPTQVVLTAPAGPLVLDFATGKVSAPGASATFWCMRDRSYEFEYGYRDEGVVSFTRPGGVLAAVCDQYSQPAAPFPSAAATMTIGAVVGDHVVVAVSNGGTQSYIGFKLSAGKSAKVASARAPQRM